MAQQLSTYWKSQTQAQAVVAEHGCKICGWKFPGKIWDVAGDLWCEHCVREMGTDIPDLETALIP